MALSDDILAEDDIEVEAVDIPEWHRKLWMRGLTGEERDAYEASRRQVRNMGTPQQELILVNDNMRANLIVKCLVDENRERIFTDRQALPVRRTARCSTGSSTSPPACPVLPTRRPRRSRETPKPSRATALLRPRPRPRMHRPRAPTTGQFRELTEWEAFYRIENEEREAADNEAIEGDKRSNRNWP